MFLFGLPSPYVVLLLVFNRRRLCSPLFEIISPARATLIVFYMNETVGREGIEYSFICTFFPLSFLFELRFDTLLVVNSMKSR